MQRPLLITLCLFLSACGGTDKSPDEQAEVFTVFDKENHLQPEFNKVVFDSLHSWDLGWALLEPINIAETPDNDKELSKRFSPGQKTLYFFWYLDEEVRNGGFIQFYWNGYGHYLPTIKEGLKLIGDNELIKLINKVDQEHASHKEQFVKQRRLNDWEPLYNDLKKFEEYDEEYYSIHDKTMGLLEQYIRLHPEDFVKLK